VRGRHRRFLFLTALLAALVGGPATSVTASPAQERENPKFILLVMGQVTWSDYLAARAPVLGKIVQEGAIGLMVVRSAGSPERGGYLTIGAGTRLRAEEEAGAIRQPEGFAFPPDEATPLGPADRVYLHLTGEQPGPAAILHLGLPNLLQENADLDYPAIPGLLGEVLRLNGLKVACLGNADLPGRPYRPAAAIAMDSKGKIPLGDVGSTLLKGEEGFPFTSPEALLRALDRVLPQADFIVIDTGDTSRLGQASGMMTEEAAHHHRLEAIRQADSLLDALLSRMNGKKWRLLIITPHLRTERETPGCRLAPVIMFGTGIQAGWLTSASTRSRGLVVNTDVAPTVLDAFHLPIPAQMVGRPMNVIPERGGAASRLGGLKKEVSRREALEVQRYLLLRPVMVFMILIFVACGAALILGERAPRWLTASLRSLCLAIISWPVVMLLLGLSLPAQPALTWAVVLLGCSLLTFAAGKFFAQTVSGFTMLSGLTFLLLASDLLLPGQPMLHYSPLSYFPADGSRYYGIGNEFGGALLGAFLFAFPVMWRTSSRWTRALRWPLMAAVVVVFGQGRLGANFGMALAAVCAAGALGFMILPRRSLRSWLWILFLLAVFAMTVGGDFFQKAPPSHIGTALAQLQQPSSGQFSGLLLRKLEMNWRLLHYSLWAQVLAAALGVIALLAFKVNPRFARGLAVNPGLKRAFFASLVGAGAAFLFNDSGTIAAALCLTYPAAMASCIAFAEEKQLQPFSCPGCN